MVEKDYGEYSCRASNPLEEDVTQKITLTGEKDYGEYNCRASNPLEEDVTQKIPHTGERWAKILITNKPCLRK